MNISPNALLTALFPPTCPVPLEAATVEPVTLHLRLTTIAPTACCPLCAAPSSAVQSRDQRHLADLPWGPLVVRLHLTVRTCMCRTTACARRIFTERLPDLAAPSARQTPQLLAALQAIGLALGGEAGARLAARLRLATGPSTLLRLVQAVPPPVAPPLQAVGVDEWAWAARPSVWSHPRRSGDPSGRRPPAGALGGGGGGLAGPASCAHRGEPGP